MTSSQMMKRRLDLYGLIRSMNLESWLQYTQSTQSVWLCEVHKDFTRGREVGEISL